MALRDELAERVGESERVLGIGVNGEGGEARPPRGGFVVDFGEGDVEDGAAGFTQVVVRDVGGDADNLVEGLIGAAFKGAADGVLAGEKGLDEGFVDDGGSGRRVLRAKSRPETRGIFIVESQPGETFRKKAGVGPGGAPLTEMSLLISMRPRSGQPEIATESTPGTARSTSAV